MTSIKRFEVYLDVYGLEGQCLGQVQAFPNDTKQQLIERFAADTDRLPNMHWRLMLRDTHHEVLKDAPQS